jgi:hypothetical protein
VPISWLKAADATCLNVISGTWGHTQFTEFDYWPVRVSSDASGMAYTSCAVTRIQADFPEVTIVVPSEHLDRVQLRRRWRSAHPVPALLRQLQDWGRRIRPKRTKFRNALLDGEMIEWLISPAGPIRSLGQDQRVAFTLAGQWIVCDTSPLLEPGRLGNLLKALDGFSRRIPDGLTGR